MNLIDLKNLIAGGESETLEFKSTTGQLTRAGETLCGLLNGRGGRVLFGVQPNGAMAGQQVTDKTLREIAETIRRIEPPASIDIARVSIPETNREVIALTAPASDDMRPYAFAGRPYQREILQILSKKPAQPLREIRKALSVSSADRTIQEDLALLRKLGLVETKGHGRGASHRLK